MAMEILDGTIDPATPIRSKGRFAIFDPVNFRDRSGAARGLHKICAKGDVADVLRKGGTGRFYLSSGGGQAGIHGVRLDDGTSAYAHYNNMEWVILFGALAGLGCLLILLAGGDPPVTPIVLGVALGGFYIFLRSVRVAGRRQYDADARRA